MREILFRGKKQNDGKWVEGYYTEYNKSFILQKSIAENCWHKEEVDPKTVGQFTGLTDKNGNKIFEGDILEFTNGEENKSYYKVYWDEDFNSYSICDCYNRIDDLEYSEDFEIVGNIHDNPELMELMEEEEE